MRTMVICAVLAACLGATEGRAQTFDCVISPAVTVRVGSPVSGVLDEVRVDQGDLVVKGQEIARLRSEVEQKTVELLAAQARSTAEIEAQDSRLALSRKRLDRVRELAASNISSREQLETAEAETEVIVRERALAELRRDVAGLELQRARAQLDQRVIRSPLDGVVVTRHLFGGEFLGTEDSVVTVAQVDPLHVVAFLPVTLYRSLEVGMVLPVRLEAPAEGVVEARVDVVDRVFDAASGTFGVRLTLPNPAGAIPAGHRCQIELMLSGQ